MGAASRGRRPSVVGTRRDAVPPPAGKKIVLLGMMTKIPVAGVVWQTLHYLVGFQRLGYDVYYVEAHAVAPSMLMMSAFDHLGLGEPEGRDHSGADHGSKRQAAFIDRQMRRFGLADRWALLAHHDDGRCYGMSRSKLRRLYGSANLIINLHGGTHPFPELAATRRLVYLETDPVLPQIELHYEHRDTIGFLDQHCALFTFGENYGRSDCGLPVSDRYELHPTRQPVVLDFWAENVNGTGSDNYTTVANWRQSLRDLMFEEETYSWSKHQEFLKFLDLPSRTTRSFELALSSYEDEDRRMLEGDGWLVRDALPLSTDIDAYRDYIGRSRGEFTVAKDQNVRFRTGWFSDRSATYLASGRPVVSQETGFSNILPTGEGLFGYSTMDEILESLEQIEADYERHSTAAREIAAEYFSHDVVLSRLLDTVGEVPKPNYPRAPAFDLLPRDLILTPESRRPTKLPDKTVETVLARPVPTFPKPPTALPGRHVSIVVVSYDNLPFTRLCLESILESTDYPGYELIVVDNGSTDGSPEYLRELADHHPHIQVALFGGNAGFAHACNHGLASATGGVLVLINNDAMVPPGWLGKLVSKLGDTSVGLVGPVTNRIGNEAEIETSYGTWGELLDFASERSEQYHGQTFDIDTLTMFCLAMRRDLYEKIGPLDERFQIGMLEDDDYSRRVREAGYRLVCAEDAFVHHFGETSFGKLIPTGEYARILKDNQRRYEEKWGEPWKPYARRAGPEYQSLTERIRLIVAETLPADAKILVVSRGDEELLKLGGRQAWHFPEAAEGVYAGHHPSGTGEAISHLQSMRDRGAQYLLFPGTAMWWLDHYEGLAQYLENQCRLVARHDDTCVIFALNKSQH
jgi:GT2 family glycosyltransferase